MRLLDVVHAVDGGICLRVQGKTDEAEATAATSVAIFYDDLRLLVKIVWVWEWVKTYGLLNLSELFELGA